MLIPLNQWEFNMAIGRPPSDERTRFLGKVLVLPSGCHEWTSTTNRGGYGKFYFRKKQSVAHRVSYQLFVGEIPAGDYVLHRCDNRKCVNPEHLFLGNAAANVADMDKKKRRGTRSRLTAKDVEEILILLGDRYSQQFIADKFGVSQKTVSRVKLGKLLIPKGH